MTLYMRFKTSELTVRETDMLHNPVFSADHRFIFVPVKGNRALFEMVQEGLVGKERALEGVGKVRWD